MIFFQILGFAFLVALSGALTPGPLLSYTVLKSIQAKKKAYLTGLYICLGHAILELALIVVLLLGGGLFISDPVVIKVIGISGAGLLVYFGVTILRDIIRKKIDFSFLERSSHKNTPEAPGIEIENKSSDRFKEFSKHPILGGVLISMSNPYWWLWWALIAWNFMIIFGVSLTNPITFWGFFIGHELGDFVWYFPVATIIGLTNKFMTKKVYIVILVVCGFFMISYGLYLGVSTYIGISVG
jgi:threonine/homoserine/homoserine lactone efflux protein